MRFRLIKVFFKTFFVPGKTTTCYSMEEEEEEGEEEEDEEDVFSMPLIAATARTTVVLLVVAGETPPWQVGIRLVLLLRERQQRTTSKFKVSNAFFSFFFTAKIKL